MTVFKYIERINLLDKLIRQRRTGTPTELAERLGISVSRLARIIGDLRDIGAPIAYDRSYGSYHYKEDYSIQINVDIQDLSSTQMKSISAGDHFPTENTLDAFFVHWSKII